MPDNTKKIPYNTFWAIIFSIALSSLILDAVYALNSPAGDLERVLLYLCVISGLAKIGEAVYWKKYLPIIAGKLKRPFWLECTAEIFYVLALVLILRGSVFDLTVVPTGSLKPTVEIGDYIFVNKTAYSLKMPITKKEIIETDSVKTGDVVVFYSPQDNKTRLIKRVIAVAGDTFEYDFETKTISLNQHKIKYIPHPSDTKSSTIVAQENLNGVFHDILISQELLMPGPELAIEGCSYTKRSMSCIIPDSHIFVMGDNRDNSFDSRFFGFVPINNVLGKAVRILFNPTQPLRIFKKLSGTA